MQEKQVIEDPVGCGGCLGVTILLWVIVVLIIKGAVMIWKVIM